MALEKVFICVFGFYHDTITKLSKPHLTKGQMGEIWVLFNKKGDAVLNIEKH
jgi:hypothetical protein